MDDDFDAGHPSDHTTPSLTARPTIAPVCEVTFNKYIATRAIMTFTDAGIRLLTRDALMINKVSSSYRIINAHQPLFTPIHVNLITANQIEYYQKSSIINATFLIDR